MAGSGGWMQAWDGWPLERFIYLFVALAYALVWVQVGLLHWRGAFRRILMWGPVIYTPVVLVTGGALVATRTDVTVLAYVVSHAVAVVEGLVGTVAHLRGISAQVGGFSLRNAMAGPPPVLPVLYTAVGALGLLTHYWNALVKAPA
jgi:hypothetical protein